MIKKLLLITILTFSLLFNNCATYVKVKLLKPSEINVGTVKKIAIADFTFKGEWDSDETTSLGAVAGQIIADVILDQFGKINKGNDSLTAYPGSEVSDKLMTKFIDNSYFKVIKREQQNLITGTGSVDNSEIVKIGNLLEVEALISGSGNYSVKDRGEWVEDTTTNNGITIRNKKYKVTRTVNTEITYRINNTATGELIASRTNSDSTSRTETGEDENKARNNLSDWRNLVDEQVNSILETSVIQIAPHYIVEDREVKDGKTPAMKAGLEYAKRYLWEDAKKSWEMVLLNSSVDASEDIINANYNLGIYNEVHGNFAKAESLFDECYKKTGKTEFLDAKSRVQYRKYEVQKLIEQNRTNVSN